MVKQNDNYNVDTNSGVIYADNLDKDLEKYSVSNLEIYKKDLIILTATLGHKILVDVPKILERKKIENYIDEIHELMDKIEKITGCGDSQWVAGSWSTYKKERKALG